MDRTIETHCYNCKTLIRISLEEASKHKTVYCPKCRLAQSHINKIIQDMERMDNDTQQ